MCVNINFCRIVSGAMIILIGIVARWLNLHAEGKYWLSISNHEVEKPKFPMLFQLQVCSLALPFTGLHLTTYVAYRLNYYSLFS